MKNFILSIAQLMMVSAVIGQTARVQAIHNSADAAAASVDVYLSYGTTNALLIDDFAFRTASPFIDAPAGTPITLGIAPASSMSIMDTIPGLSTTVTLTAGETYVLIANGIVSATGYSPAPAFGLSVNAMGREMASTAGNTDVLVFHGATDAPTVDVRERTLGSTIVDNAAYGDFAGYLELPTNDYILDVQDETGSITVASYAAPLQTLGLTDSALVVVASGFLNPMMNSNGPAFGLFAALPSGGALIPLPTTGGPTARAQIIHNSADMAASVVDVYVNGALTLDDFEFRTTTGYLDLPATTPLQVAIAPSNSSSVGDSIAVFNYNLEIDETYVLIAEGIVSPSGYSPATPFDIAVYGMGRESASISGNTDILVHHGSTDAPTVDIDETTAGNLVDDISYGEYAGYLELPTADYTILVKDASGANTVASFDAPLQTLGLNDSALVVIASGFLDPSMNSNGEAFGLFVAVSSGDLVALPVSAPNSVNDMEVRSFNVYPNPANDVIYIENETMNQDELIIYDMQGKVVNPSLYSINGSAILIESLPKGIYQIMLTTEENGYSQTRFIKN